MRKFARSPWFAITLLLLGMPATAAAAADKPEAHQVTIDNFTFSPTNLVVAVGSKVVWVNRDDIPHAVLGVGRPPTFKSPPLDTGDRFTFTFAKPGVYRYFCSLHPMMTATITVR